MPNLPKTLIALSNREEAWGQTCPHADPSLITVKKFAELALRAAGRQPKLRVAGLVSPFIRGVGEMQYLWATLVNMDDSRLRRLLPDLRKTPYEEGIRSTLAEIGSRRGACSPPQTS